MSALSVKCPSCGAEPRKQCRDHTKGALLSVKHLGRNKKAEAKYAEASTSSCPPHAARIAAAQRETGATQSN